LYKLVDNISLIFLFTIAVLVVTEYIYNSFHFARNKYLYKDETVVRDGLKGWFCVKQFQITTCACLLNHTSYRLQNMIQLFIHQLCYSTGLAHKL